MSRIVSRISEWDEGLTGLNSQGQLGWAPSTLSADVPNSTRCESDVMVIHADQRLGGSETGEPAESGSSEAFAA